MHWPEYNDPLLSCVPAITEQPIFSPVKDPKSFLIILFTQLRTILAGFAKPQDSILFLRVQAALD